MSYLRLSSPARAVAAGLVACLLLLAVAAAPASAYTKPKGGRWIYRNLFENTKKGSLVLARNGSKIAKLVLVPGERNFDTCGRATVRLKSRPKIRSYRSVNGRYAVGKLKKGLFVPTRAVFKQGKKTRRGKLLALWDDPGTTLTPGKVVIGGCTLDFYANKRR